MVDHLSIVYGRLSDSFTLYPISRKVKLVNGQYLGDSKYRSFAFLKAFCRLNFSRLANLIDGANRRRDWACICRENGIFKHTHQCSRSKCMASSLIQTFFLGCYFITFNLLIGFFSFGRVHLFPNIVFEMERIA